MALLTPMNENVCELPPTRCGFTRRPSDADLRKIQEATGLPKHVIDRAFSTRGGSRSKKGGLSDWQKDKVCSAILVLAAGGTVFYAVPLAEAFLVQIGLLPVLCDQNLIEHIGINLISLGTGGATESCAQRSSRYNVIAATIVTTLSATGLFSRDSIRLHYNLAHAYVKARFFQDATAVAAAEAALRAAQAQPQVAITRVAQQTSAPYQPTSPNYDPNVPPQLSPVVEQQVSPPRGRTTGRRNTRTAARSRSASDSSGTESQTGRRRTARSRGKGTKRSNAKGVRVTRKHKKHAKKHAKKHHKKHAKKHTKKHTKKHARKHRGRKTGKRGRARR
jgi:hypothetical protein